MTNLACLRGDLKKGLIIELALQSIMAHKNKIKIFLKILCGFLVITYMISSSSSYQNWTRNHGWIRLVEFKKSFNINEIKYEKIF